MRGIDSEFRLFRAYCQAASFHGVYYSKRKRTSHETGAANMLENPCGVDPWRSQKELPVSSSRAAAVLAYSSWHIPTQASQKMERSRTRRTAPDKCLVSSVLREWSGVQVACARSHKDRGISQSPIARDPPRPCQSDSCMGRKSWVCGSWSYRCRSTIQQANIAYPSDASLLVKLARKSAQVLKAVDKVFLGNKTGPYAIDLKAIGNKAKGYFFAKAEKKKQALANLVETVQDQLLIPMQSIQSFTTATTNKLSWNIREAINQIKDLGSKILESARYYVKTGKAMPGRIHSMHLTAVDFFNKNKPGKKWEMGRQIQIARLTGNFVITPEHITTHCTDKQAMAHVIKAHAILFGSDQIKSISADKGYYSRANIKSCKEAGAAQIGIQVPHRARVSKEIKLAGEALRNRRAGVEPVIQHVKEHGLNRSKMKSDVATLGSAYQAMGGFNLNQLLRRLR